MEILQVIIASLLQEATDKLIVGLGGGLLTGIVVYLYRKYNNQERLIRETHNAMFGVSGVSTLEGVIDMIESHEEDIEELSEKVEDNREKYEELNERIDELKQKIKERREEE